MMFEDFDGDDFADLGLQLVPKSADLKMTCIKMGRHGTVRVQFNFAPTVLEEIDGPRYSIGFATSRKTGARAFRIAADPKGRFEAMTPGRGDRRLLRCPAPIGNFSPADGVVEPEYFVDRIGKVILVEVPEQFLPGKPKALPPPPVPREHPAVAKGADLDDEETRRAVDRRLRDLLTTGVDVPRVIAGATYTPAERMILAALLSHPQVSREGLLAATADPEKGEDDRDPKLVDVFLSKMRVRLQAIDVRIENIGLGAFRMSVDAKTRLRAAISAGGGEP